jgi:hypothetical protein
VIEEADISAIFGIDMEENPKKPVKKAASKKTAQKKTAKSQALKKGEEGIS